MASELESAPTPDPDLLLRALRYVTGELGSDEEAAFERRLDEDQGAREAVAEAVALAGAIAALKPTDNSVPTIRRRRLLPAVVGLAAAACLAWFFVLPPAPA